MIPRKIVDAVLDATRIEDVIGDFVPLKRRGANYIACCPFHEEKTPSFSVSPTKSIYKCFGCGESGSAVNFLMKHENLDYVGALKWLGAKYHIEVEEVELSSEDLARRSRSESLLLVNDFAAKSFAENLKTAEGQALGLSYFRHRGLSDETIARFGLGWALTDREAFAKKATAEGYKTEYLVETGLCIKRDNGSIYDRFAERAIFPIHNVNGRVIAFGGRTLKGDKTVAKYVNSPESEIYDKSRSLYGIYFAKGQIAKEDCCILVEGYLDVISMHQRGVTNVVASSGTSLTVQQVQLIKRYTRNITILYDGDSAGIKAALRGIDLVLAEDMNVSVALLEGGQDPDDFAKAHSKDEILQWISGSQTDFISFKSRMLLENAGSDPIVKASKINDIADSIARIPDPVKREMCINQVSSLFDISTSAIASRVSSTIHQINITKGEQLSRNIQNERREHSEGREATLVPGLHSLRRPLAAGEILFPTERELLERILVHGFESIVRKDGGCEQFSVAEYIDASLTSDGLSITHPLYKEVYDLYFQYYDEGLDEPQIHNRLLEAESEDVRAICHELMMEKYPITVESYRNSLTSEATLLSDYVPQCLSLYKSLVLDGRIKDKTDELVKAMKEGRSEQEMQKIQKEINTLKKIRRELKIKGGRI